MSKRKPISKKLRFETVYNATEIAFTQYDVSTDYGWEKAFKKLGGICYNLAHEGDDAL